MQRNARIEIGLSIFQQRMNTAYQNRCDTSRERNGTYRSMQTGPWNYTKNFDSLCRTVGRGGAARFGVLPILLSRFSLSE